MTDNTTEINLKIRDILLTEWDPIGISAFPEAEDEYDGYIYDISLMLASKKSADEIYGFLLWAETDHMGLPANRAKARFVAGKLANLSN